MRMALVVLYRKIIKREIKYRLHIRVYFHLWQWKWCTLKLQFCLLQMVKIQMRIAKSVYKITQLQTSYLCDHHQQQGKHDENAD